ncbi:MAG TPA: response regulator, partial [bacterium]|nr:response regulator [bacterium]
MPDVEKNPACILIAEDEEDIRNVLVTRLASEGYEARAVVDGQAAIEILRAEEIDVLVLDVWMPRVNGFDVLRTAREIAPDTEVVIVTADDSLATQVEALRMGAFDVVRKPFGAADLLSTVARAAERRKLRAATALYQASRVIFTTTDPEQLPEQIVDVSMKAMEADAVSLMLPGQGGQLHIAHANHIPEDVRKSTIIRLGEPIAGKVAADRKPLVLSGPVPDGKVARVPDSSIVYPLFAGDRLVGVLNLNRGADRKPFRTADLERAGVLASQIVLALENSRLFRRSMTSERLATVGQVAAGMAHEINNPASFVATNVSHVRERLKAIDAARPGVIDTAELNELYEALDDAAEGIERIAQIVRDIRGISRGDDGESRPFDANDAVRSAIRMAATEIRGRATIATALEERAMVVGAQGRLSQVFVNLLTNATHAVASLPPERRVIAVRSRTEGGKVIVEVSDKGTGIPPEALPRLFEPFFTTRKQGLGLGLSISREIVLRHGGDLQVESEVGVGTTFKVVLPAMPVAELPPKPPRLRLLFVDDEPAMVRSYRRAFQNEFDVTVAGGGLDALRLLEDSKFDVVV